MQFTSFSFSGIVQRNLGRGRKLGYPTANIQIPSDLPEGIFVGHTFITEKKYPSIIFIGHPITFSETDKKAEVYILDFDQDIYDQYIEVDVLKKQRDNEKFESVEKLIVQMKEDERLAREFFDKKI